MSMILTVNDHNGIPVVELAGKVKGEGDKHLQTCLEELLKGPAKKVVVDLSKAEYIDSHGLGVIIYYHKMLSADKRALIVLNADSKADSYMARLIEITNLDKVLTVASSLEGL
jgi:anti-anti-sigma factor